MAPLESAKSVFEGTTSRVPVVAAQAAPEMPVPREPGGPPVTLCVVGCGQRGKVYASYALSRPELCTVVAIAEPRPKTRDLFAAEHRLMPERVFASWGDLLAASQKALTESGTRLADAVVIAVQDKMHAAVVKEFAAQGFHILCEKPMATSPGDCIRMADSVAAANIIFAMGHVLRYSPYVQEISHIVRSGVLGELLNVNHIEPVGYFHFAHSYVRGNWCNEADSSFTLMTKGCHDIDLLCHWFSPATPVRVSSFGSLSHFRPSAKPAAARDATRCLDCPAEQACAYSAKKIYLDAVSHGHTGWPVGVLTDGPPDIENVTRALTHGPYGRCVYDGANDVVDHQVVNFEFSSGATASFTLVAFTSLICERQTRMHFSHGEIVGDMSSFTVTNFATRATTRHSPPKRGGGHGGGDRDLAAAFVKAVATGRQDVLGTDVREVLKSHLTVFAAEQSRKDGVVVNCEEFEARVRKDAA